MLSISTAGLDTLAATQRRQFQERLLAQLAVSHGPPHDAMERAERQDLIGAALNKAARLGIEDQHGVAMLANLMMLYGTDFDQRADLPWIGQILGRTGVPGPVRMAQLNLAIRARLAGRTP